MTMDVRHIRSANLDPTTWTTLAEARVALNGPGYDNALMNDLYVTGGTPAPNTNDSGTLAALFRITADHRVYLYFISGGVVQEMELIFGFA
jgi:hypothetical protein